MDTLKFIWAASLVGCAFIHTRTKETFDSKDILKYMIFGIALFPAMLLNRIKEITKND
jgi:hypothetical protein